MRALPLIIIVLWVLQTPLAQGNGQINSTGYIDVHRHASWPEGDDEHYLAKTLTEMDAAGFKLAVISLTDYDQIKNWLDAAPDKFIAGVMLGCPRNLSAPRYKCFPSDEGWVNIDWLEEQVKLKKVQALHEVGPNYYGISIGNPRYQPYFELAQKYNIPVGIHTQRGPPPGAKNSTRKNKNCCPDYDPEMGNPSLIRPVLKRFPQLKIWIQHVGAGRSGGYEPFWEETLALLNDYPNVYLDLSITNGPRPIRQYESSLRKLIDAGFGDRIMMGSDNVPLKIILKRLESFQWLTEKQKQNILYRNAERFFSIN